MTKLEFANRASQFLSNIEKDISSGLIRLEAHWDIDHICYRVESVERYIEIKSFLLNFSSLLAESQVNGRPICTFKLKEPFFLGDKAIFLVELPAPKEGKLVSEGFEHIEVVIDIPFDEAQKRFEKFKQKTEGLRKDFNQELVISLEKYAVKFHHLSLESVVNLENNEKVFEAICKSRVLSLLKKYQPLIAGTFPLGISQNESDVDVLLFANNFEELMDEIEIHFKNEASFEAYCSEQNGERYVVARFKIDEVPFELFGQSIETVKQRAYKHFQIEERLLKLGGGGFKNRIQELRADGIKTEPAFTKALNLSGDPYLKLLELHSKSDNELRHILVGVE